jgi:hypothetical protein
MTEQAKKRNPGDLPDLAAGRDRSGVSEKQSTPTTHDSYTAPVPPVDHTACSPDELRDLLSIGRFGRYVAAAGSPEEAIRLYDWNTYISGAMYEALGMFEIVLRNAMDRQLRTYHRIVLAGDERWTTDSRMPWRSTRISEQLHQAREYATEGGRVPEIHGKVIAELTLGFWRYLLTARYQAILWAPALRHAFPHLKAQNRETIYHAVDRLHRLRNRIAHHEPVHSVDLANHHQELLKAASWIAPTARTWIGGVSRVPSVLATRPRRSLSAN